MGLTRLSPLTCSNSSGLKVIRHGRWPGVLQGRTAC